MDKLGIGLIGCGGRLRGIAQRVTGLCDRIQVTALCDPSPDAISKARGIWGGDLPAYDDHRQLAADPRVDWVFIGSWNCFHCEQTVAAFEAGKHVFCEKPLATNLDDCLKMRDAGRASGKHFSIGFTLRYSPHYRRLKELLEDGAIGELISMEFNETLAFNHGGYIHADWRRKQQWAGTHLLEKCCHDVDLVNWFVGSLATRVASFGGLDFFTAANRHHQQRVGTDAEGRPAFATWPLADPTVNPFNDDKDIVDNQVAILQFANGVRSTFHTNCMAGINERRMYLCGSEGAIRADVVRGQIELQRIGFDTEIEDCSTDASGGHGGGDSVLARELIATMTADTPPAAGLEDGLKAAITCFAIDDAMDQGKVVDCAPYWAKAGITVAEG